MLCIVWFSKILNKAKNQKDKEVQCMFRSIPATPILIKVRGKKLEL